MFTGLIEGKGTVMEMVPEGPGILLKIVPPAEMLTAIQGGTNQKAAIGDSVAINGCCLTIVAIDPATNMWAFQAGSETLSKTNLGKLATGDFVNMERAIAANARLGGHFVQGHVDGQAEVIDIIHEGDWVHIHFSMPQALGGQMVPKGSITLDGVSLTLVEVKPDRFSIALIPHTLDVTTLGSRKIGDMVNLETDILGKYVEKLVSQRGDN